MPIDDSIAKAAGPYQPWLVLDLPADGKTLRLIDFASAGATGKEYQSWLPASDVRPPRPVAWQPVEGAKLGPGTIRLTWRKPADSALANGRHTNVISDTPTFERTIVRYGDQTGDALAIPREETAKLQPGVVYYWKIVARNEYGNREPPTLQTVCDDPASRSSIQDCCPGEQWTENTTYLKRQEHLCRIMKRKPGGHWAVSGDRRHRGHRRQPLRANRRRCATMKIGCSTVNFRKEPLMEAASAFDAGFSTPKTHATGPVSARRLKGRLGVPPARRRVWFQGRRACGHRRAPYFQPQSVDGITGPSAGRRGRIPSSTRATDGNRDHVGRRPKLLGNAWRRFWKWPRRVGCIWRSSRTGLIP